MADYGTGADGALNFDGTASVLGMSPVTLGAFKIYFRTGANINASSASIGSHVVVAMQNWKFYCTGAVVGAGSTLSFIHCNGPDAPAAIAASSIVNATAVPAGFYDVGAPGNNGTSGDVVNAIPAPNTTTGHASPGTSGGSAVTPGSDGPSPMKGGGGGAIWNANQSFVGVRGGDHTALTSSSGYTPADQKAGIPADNPTTKYRWGSGGGQGVAGAIGAGGGTNPTGGGGGASGACLFVAAFSISGVCLQANGGRGGDGAAGTIGTSAGGAGGGGGGGGVLIFYYDTKTDVIAEARGGGPGLAAVHGVGCLASNGGSGADGWTYLYDGLAITSGDPDSVYWGPHFPDAGGLGYYWGPHFPDGKITTTSTPPSTVGGAATFVLLESGSKLQLSYGEDTINQKMWSGAEYRESMLDDPKRTFVGAATLLGDTPRALRAQLARFAAVGSVFGLAIPYDAITTTGNASTVALGFLVPTSPTGALDWMQVGQRVAFTDGSGYSSLDAVVQDFTTNSVTIDKDPGTLGRIGVTIMPIVPIFLDPAMPMTRFRGPSGVEQWQLNARAAVFGYPVAANKAFALFTGATGALAAASVRMIYVGSFGNVYTFKTVGDSGLTAGSVSVVGTAYTFHYKPGVTTVNAMATAMASVMEFTNADPSAVLVAGDAVGPLTLRGGTDLGYGTPGVGATVATYDGRPFWDHHVQVKDSATDSIQSLAEIVDLGGIPISIGTATQPDWGRALLVNRELGDEFQWLKAFLAAVRGCQRAFWLPSYRADLVGASWSGSNLIVSGPGDAFGDLASWWPLQRDRIQVAQADGTLVLAKITAVVDNGNGTLTLTLGTVQGTASGAAVTRVSWLELCRFDSPTFEITFDANGQFSMPTKARVVQG